LLQFDHLALPGDARMVEHRDMLPSDVVSARLMLVPQRRDTVAPRDPSAPKVRRYRLARVQLNPPAIAARGRARHDHLRRTHD
jgi:hypothetical protein